MRNSAVLQWIYDRYERNIDVVAVTVVDTFDRSPYPAGSMMAIDRCERFEGSVSSGCVEVDLYERARSLFGEHPDTLVGIGCEIIDFDADRSGRDPFAASGPCRGTLRVAMHAVTPQHFPELATLVSSVQQGLPVTTFLNLRTGQMSLNWRGDAPMFRTDYKPKPRMLIFGISDIATGLAALALPLGFAVTVCDPRPVFLQEERFVSAVKLVRDWPDRYLRCERKAGRINADTAIVDLTHDDRFSIPLLIEALDSRRWSHSMHPAFVGALGSSVRSTRKRHTLRQHGLLLDDVNRLQAPIGLDLGGREAPAITLSILAQVVAAREGGSGMPRSQLVD
ncbi:XdhC family protein [Mycolicibacterium sp. CBMA 226]|uniref:XdhC family protein n=1 Tax=Mycolicibacterium sp. CBMA 226 TaxID=2606611 RepID=UPI0014122DA1|nr:XdhC/CoxI family protein [Mycolicibacterium sp. CBMA 226]